MKEKTFKITEVAEYIADAFLAPLYTWDNDKVMLGILQNSCPELIIQTRDGFMFNPKTALKLKIDLKDHFKSLDEFEDSLHKAILPLILKDLEEELEDDVEESNTDSLPSELE